MLDIISMQQIRSLAELWHGKNGILLVFGHFFQFGGKFPATQGPDSHPLTLTPALLVINSRRVLTTAESPIGRA